MISRAKFFLPAAALDQRIRSFSDLPARFSGAPRVRMGGAGYMAFEK